MKPYIYIFIFFAALVSHGADQLLNAIGTHDPNYSLEMYETNTIFVTDDGHAFRRGQGDGTMVLRMNPQKMEEAKKTRESLPAKDFPEGNWGELAEGVQLSLRFDKAIYTNGETIKATVLVRNTTNEFFVFPVANNKVNLREIDFQVVAESGQVIVSKPVYSGLRMGGRQVTVMPGTQRKYMACLNDTYDLTNGNYFIQASINASYSTTPNASTWIEIKSAKVPIAVK